MYKVKFNTLKISFEENLVFSGGIMLHASDVDIAFMVDSTASMGRYIDQVKNHIADIVRNIVEKFNDSRVRIGFVGYRDYTEGKARFEVLEMTHIIQKFVQYVGLVRAYAGGDVPEDVLGALDKTLALHL